MSQATLNFEELSRAVQDAVALRMITQLNPAAGAGAKIFPPTYVSDDNRRFGETRYATETRRIDGEDRPCVLLDSVASQANRMELALLTAWQERGAVFPLVRVDFSSIDDELEARIGSVSSLEAPHRIYDAILRDAVDESGTLFRHTTVGQEITAASVRDASALYRYCPTALIFGAWDSTGPKGGMGSKFQRLVSSEIVAIGVRTGTRVGSRLDPLGIVKGAGPVFRNEGETEWSIEKKTKKAKALHPSDINHGNVAPSRDTEAGGVTFDYAQQTTVLSFPALRRLRFGQRAEEAERAARCALASLCMLGVAAAHAEGYDLRSGALLVGEGANQLELIESDGRVSATYNIGLESAEALHSAAVAEAVRHDMGWEREPLSPLKPAEKLAALLKKSQTLEAGSGGQTADSE